VYGGNDIGGGNDAGGSDVRESMGEGSIGVDRGSDVRGRGSMDGGSVLRTLHSSAAQHAQAFAMAE